MTVTLKRSLGDGGAAMDESSGLVGGRLYDLLKEISTNPPQTHNIRQAAVATGVLHSWVTGALETKLRRFIANLAVCGSAGNTVVQFRVGGVVKATLTIDNTDPDPTTKDSGVLNIAIPANSVCDINVSAAPTGGTGLSVSATLSPIDVE